MNRLAEKILVGHPVRITALGLLLTCQPVAASETGSSEDYAFFESKIRPVLAERCYDCHSLESGKSKGGLRLDSREAVLRGGESGPALVPGKPEESLLLLAVRQEDPDFEMPPKGEPLSTGEIDAFRRWIIDGAPDPREEDPDAAGQGAGGNFDRTSRLDHWSYQPVRRPQPPELFPGDGTDNPDGPDGGNAEARDWSGTAIDRFVFAELEEQGLAPSPPADPVTLLRRLCFDLTGLPPTPEQVANFSPARLEETVDELLASEAFGERWARHWLDVVRFAESNGRDANIVYPHAWRYRDYVIDAFQRDLPYDRFLTEQIAGDLLPAENDRERARLLVATGFLAVGAKGLAMGDDLAFQADVADEQIDALGRAFLGTSLACARCHDHKSDPVSMEDYYALAGIFKSTDTRFGTWIDSENQQGGHLIRLPDVPGQIVGHRDISRKQVEKHQATLDALDEEERRIKKRQEQMKKEGIAMKREDFNKAVAKALGMIWKRGGAEGRLEIVDDQGRALPMAMGVLDAGEMVHSPLYERGEITRPGDPVPRAVPALFGLGPEGETAEEESGRLQLAQWVTDPENPLTARVMANRIWAHLFGAGLVPTVDNFGPTGKAPSHPELLDWLAAEFVGNGWSVKSLVREIVLTRAYRQGSAWRQDAFERDPDNRTLWRMEKRRLEAEAIRDAMLAVSGELDPSPRPASLAAEVRPHSVPMIAFDKNAPDDLDGSLRRSVYLPVFRDNLPDVLDLFDFAEPSLVTGQRDITNVPPQALYLMNSEFVRARAEGFAERLLAEANTRGERVERAFALCFQRAPEQEERALAEEFLAEVAGDDRRDPGAEGEALVQFCHALLASAEFRIAD